MTSNYSKTIAARIYQDSSALRALLSGQRFKLDCGHHVTFGHNFANTVIIHSEGGRKINTLCHSCGY